MGIYGFGPFRHWVFLALIPLHQVFIANILSFQSDEDKQLQEELTMLVERLTVSIIYVTTLVPINRHHQVLLLVSIFLWAFLMVQNHKDISVASSLKIHVTKLKNFTVLSQYYLLS